MGSRFHMREQPARQVFVREIDIANMFVTVGQIETFIESNAYQQDRWSSKPGWDWLHDKSDGWGRENRNIPDAWTIQERRISHPVVGITYFEAEAYCNWIAYYKKKVIRMPDEKEWEYAARGPDGRPYPWGVFLGMIGYLIALLVDLTGGRVLGRTGAIRLAQAEQENRELHAEQARLQGAIRERDEKLTEDSIDHQADAESNESQKIISRYQ